MVFILSLLQISQPGILMPELLSAGDVINVHCTIYDSLSRDSIKEVHIAIESLQKSFNTKRSGFFMSVPAGEYEIVFTAPGYEEKTVKLNVGSQSSDFVVYLVKTQDREKINETRRLQKAYLDSLYQAFQKADAPMALRIMDAMSKHLSVSEEISKAYEKAKVFWTDSLMKQAQVLEDSGKLADAYYYYKKVFNFDTLCEEAAKKMAEIDKKFSWKKSRSTPKAKKVVVKKKTPEEIGKLYQQGIEQFLAEDYKTALKTFKEVLRYDPGHKGAKKYLKRTEIRLKVLGQ